MAWSPQLVWNNPNPVPHFTLTARMLSHLSEAIITRVNDGELQSARGLMSLYALSPIEAGVVAERLFRAGVPEEVVLKIV
jgi:hypothetical protein